MGSILQRVTIVVVLIGGLVGTVVSPFVRTAVVAASADTRAKTSPPPIEVQPQSVFNPNQIYLMDLRQNQGTNPYQVLPLHLVYTGESKVLKPKKPANR